MLWLYMTITCILVWGVNDILYKKSLPQNDSLAHFKGLIWNGIVMGIAGIIMIFFSDTFVSSVKSLKENWYLIPVAILYPLALFFGLKGKQQLEVSVVSPIENIDGAMAAIILYVFFVFTGNSAATKNISILDIIATISIVIAVVSLGIQEQKLSKNEKGLTEDKKKHKLGAIALLFPIIYNLVDALSMVLTGITVNDTTTNGISDVDFFIFEGIMFLFMAIIMWLYLLISKKYVYNPFKKVDKFKCSAALGETAGTMLFIFSIAINPVLTAPIVSSYCIVTIIIARLFLKEKLTKKQYISLVFLVIGVVLLGASELLK